MNALNTPEPLDAQDAKLLAKYTSAWRRTPSPRVGDFVILPDGDKRVISYVKRGWRTSFGKPDEQIIDEVTVDEDLGRQNRAFYLSAKGAKSCGHCGYRRIQLSSLIDTGEMRPGEFKFVHHGGMPWEEYIHVHLPCRVYQWFDACRTK